MDIKKKFKVISLSGHTSPYIDELVLKNNKVTNFVNDHYTIFFKNSLI